MEEEYTYTVDIMIDNLITELYPYEFKEKLLKIFTLLNTYNNPIDTKLLNLINDKDLDTDNLSYFVINTVKKELTEVYLENNIVVNDSDLLTSYNILYTLNDIMDVNPELLQPILDTLENDEYDNIEKISHIVSDYTVTTYDDVYKCIEYIPDVIIISLRDTITKIVESSELSDIDNLEYFKLVLHMLKSDRYFYKTSYYINYNKNELDCDIIAHTKDIVADVYNYADGFITLETLANSILAYLITSTNDNNKYDTYVDTVTDVILDGYDNSIIKLLTNVINTKLNTVIDAFAKED